MAFTYHISTSIEINAPPAHVRQTLLDFPSVPQWSKTHIQSIEVVKPAPSTTSESSSAIDGPAVGSQLKVAIPSMTFTPVVVTNTPDEFAWLGSFAIPKVVFDGRHSFVFNAKGENKTELVQTENFTGVLCSLMKWTSMGADTEKGFKAFNEEIKKRCEESAGAA
ncbi:hypothetical protein P389DRAFT_168899 [Cystobasidium minutum MCA 4210]|uniref:uncharacterized protein n=1 Tax=Cystobasidium minutum MCA 4210 TaxID=1397322 RepID=UPI0034CF992F|eukprot:jgi/Rhomi1/168899/fgenesh1_kg.3_\